MCSIDVREKFLRDQNEQIHCAGKFGASPWKVFHKDPTAARERRPSWEMYDFSRIIIFLFDFYFQIDFFPFAPEITLIYNLISLR